MSAECNADYLQAKGQDYRNTPFLKAYGHDGEPCPNCGNTLKKKKRKQIYFALTYSLLYNSKCTDNQFIKGNIYERKNRYFKKNNGR